MDLNLNVGHTRHHRKSRLGCKLCKERKVKVLIYSIFFGTNEVLTLSSAMKFGLFVETVSSDLYDRNSNVPIPHIS